MGRLDLSVHVGTKLNRTHLLVARETYVLPCLGRTELDVQETGPQSVTVEDSMSMVHASAGKLAPASGFLRSEPAIVAGIATATLPDSKVPWLELVADYDRIRDLIEKTVPGLRISTRACGSPADSACPCRQPSANGKRHRARPSSTCSGGCTKTRKSLPTMSCGW